MIVKHATVDGEEYVRATDVVQWIGVIAEEARAVPAFQDISPALLVIKLENITQRLLALR